MDEVDLLMGTIEEFSKASHRKGGTIEDFSHAPYKKNGTLSKAERASRRMDSLKSRRSK